MDGDFDAGFWIIHAVIGEISQEENKVNHPN
jgi:hypothetical protein